MYPCAPTFKIDLRPFKLDYVAFSQSSCKSKLATSAGFSGLVVAIAPALASEQQNDAVARTVLTNAPPSWSSNELLVHNASGPGLVSSAGPTIKSGLAAGGIITASALFSVTMTAVLQALPMLQAIILLGIYALLPLMVVLSRYSISMMGVGAMAVFTVKFWSVLWYLAMWVDQNLILSMYPDVNLFLQVFANPGEHDFKRMLLNMITTSLYLGLPLLWSIMMAWAGIRAGQSLDHAMQPLSTPVHDAGRQGGAFGRAAVIKGVRK